MKEKYPVGDISAETFLIGFSDWILLCFITDILPSEL